MAGSPDNLRHANRVQIIPCHDQDAPSSASLRSRPDWSRVALSIHPCRPQRSERHQRHLLGREDEWRRSVRSLRIPDTGRARRRAGGGRAHVRRGTGHRRARSRLVVPGPPRPRFASGAPGLGGAEPADRSRLFRCRQGPVPGAQAVRGSCQDRRRQPREDRLHRLPRRRGVAGDRHEPERDAESAGRQRHQRLRRRTRRRLLQRPPGVLPLDQLRAAVLQDPAGDDRSPRARRFPRPCWSSKGTRCSTSILPTPSTAKA